MKADRGIAIVLGRLNSVRAYVESESGVGLAGAIVLESGVGPDINGTPVLGSAAEWDAALKHPLASSASVVCVLDAPEDLGITVGDLLRMTRTGRRVLRKASADEFIDVARSVRCAPDDLTLKALLGRDGVAMPCLDLAALAKDARVLVTGAGGSIGSEICLMLARMGCRHLTMLDNTEHNLFTIDRRISAAFPGQSRRAILCDIRDRKHVSSVIAREKPTYVFHAAALKHVPMVELHPCEGVLTNLIGTRNVADACARAGIRAMTFISTDKAVQPTSVMGLTKRLAEDYVRARDREGRAAGGASRFVTVRFGNVLGTSGSVAPIFAEQIEAGGPVTITHPDMERFFMSPAEAVRLTLRATMLGIEESDRDCGLYVLEMGDPIRILEFARRMIESFGLVVGRDIPISVVGPRPGEKITEALIDDDEIGAASGVPGIVEVLSDAPALSVDALARLEAAARDHDDALVLRLLDDIRNRRNRSAVA